MNLLTSYVHLLKLLCIQLFIIFVAGGCSCYNPSNDGMVAPCYNDEWQGPEMPRGVINLADAEAASHAPDGAQLLELGEMVNIALSNNPLTQRSWFTARSQAFLYLRSQSTLYPAAELQETLTFSKFHSNSSAGGADSTIVNGGISGVGSGAIATSSADKPAYQQSLFSSLTLSYLLFDFGGRQGTIESARMSLFSANWAHNQALQTVLVNLLTSYYNFLGTRSLVEAREKDLQDSKASLDAAQKLYESGINAKVDYLQAKTNYVNVELSLTTLRGQLQIAMSQLAVNMGLAPDTELKIGEVPKKIPFEKVDDDIEKLMAEAKERRPDLQGAYADFQKQWAELQVAKSAGLPTLSAFGNFETNTYFHQSLLNTRLYEGQLTLNVPLFNGFYYWYNTKSAQQNLETYWAQFRNQEQQVLLGVATSYYTYKTSIKAMSYTEEYLKYAQEAYDAAFGSYKEGVKTILDVLSAQAVLANARSQRIQAVTQWAISLANLAYSTGTIYGSY